MNYALETCDQVCSFTERYSVLTRKVLRAHTAKYSVITPFKYSVLSHLSTLCSPTNSKSMNFLLNSSAHEDLKKKHVNKITRAPEEIPALYVARNRKQITRVYPDGTPCISNFSTPYLPFLYSVLINFRYSVLIHLRYSVLIHLSYSVLTILALRAHKSLRRASQLE